jgi:hypothetical protein
MDKQQFDRKGSIVVSASGMVLETEFLNADYQPPQVNPEKRAGETGLLELFRIMPCQPGFPTFVGRIGHDDQDAVDVDLIGNAQESCAFGSQALGYVGHNTRELKTDPRSYSVTITAPGVGHVFSGTLTLKCVGFGRRVFDSLKMTDVAKAVITEKSN